MSKKEPKTRAVSQTHTATQILRDMVYSLLDSGFQKQAVVAALNTLTDEAAGDDWKKGLETRKLTRGLGR
jgi:hypothetical protein